MRRVLPWVRRLHGGQLLMLTAAIGLVGYVAGSLWLNLTQDLADCPTPLLECKLLTFWPVYLGAALVAIVCVGASLAAWWAWFNARRRDAGRQRLWRVPALAAAGLALLALAEFFFRRGAGAEWLTAAGGFGVMAFASVQLDLEGKRYADRLAAARAKLKPVARLARRMCEEAVIESDGKPVNQWLGRWYLSRKQVLAGGDAPGWTHPLDALEHAMRETVTLAAEAGGPEVRAADAAFDAFLAAADMINDMAKTLIGVQDDTALKAGNPRARQAANYLLTAAQELVALSPRGEREPALPANPKFLYEA